MKEDRQEFGRNKNVQKNWILTYAFIQDFNLRVHPDRYLTEGPRYRRVRASSAVGRQGGGFAKLAGKFIRVDTRWASIRRLSQVAPCPTATLSGSRCTRAQRRPLSRTHARPQTISAARARCACLQAGCARRPLQIVLTFAEAAAREHHRDRVIELTTSVPGLGARDERRLPQSAEQRRADYGGQAD